MINELSVNAEETAVIISVWWLDVIHYIYVFYDGYISDIKHIDVLDSVAATISLDGISAEFKQILVLSCKGMVLD